MKKNPPVHYGKENNMYRHGLSRTKLEKAYFHMLDRCYKPNSDSYANYGGRGIEVCEEWRNDNKAFYEWSMSNGYVEGLSLDRIDPNGNYCPNNCRWVTNKVQQNNRRNNISVEIDGVRHTVAEWSEIYGISRYAIYTRIKRLGWDAEKAITTPSLHRGGKQRKGTI